MTAPRIVERRCQDSGRFLIGMKAHGVFRLHKVQQKGRLALKVERGNDLGLAHSAHLGDLKVVNELDQCVHREVAHLHEAPLDRLDAIK